ncbi:unnamed protein product [Brassicogethes aeneus]|uniref:Uncharacterized protein n=1 Tax=Brassicogethes aeneus TaxID=1431903 RepID=A0A9P0B8Q3_BRAAE|nr:unnamed protein product [Brassicogethes aeneus]
MGSSGSKIGEIPGKVKEGSVPSTPILTPKNVKNIDVNGFDPRSPTANICRTPIQVLLDEENASPDKVTLGMDPRSPAVEFTRTPIVVKATDEDLLRKVQRRNLLNPSKNVVAPRLLESSPITTKPEANKRKSLVGILETNVDFMETDLDFVMQQKKKDVLHRVDIVKNDNMDPRSPTAEFMRTPLQIARKIGEIELNDEEIKESIEEKRAEEQFLEKLDDIINENKEKDVVDEGNLEEDFNEHIIEKLERSLEDQQFLEKLDEITDEKEEVNVKLDTNNEEIVEETEAEITPSLVEEIKKIQEEIEQEYPLPESIKTIENSLKTKIPELQITPIANVTQNVREFDKKLTHLIYEDKDLVVLPRVVKLRENNRTPLGNRNSTGEIRNVPKLKVSDKPRKSDGHNKKSEYAVSKIPVFKEKGKKMQVQCENTPPMNMDLKPRVNKRKSHWDNDNTMVI